MTSPTAQPGEIGRYQVRSRLGAGGFATVWLAYDEQLDDQVAIKVLADNWAHDPDVRRRFASEARTMRRIRDPRVATVHDIAATPDGRPFFVMEYADGGSLLDRVAHRAASDQAFSFAEAVALSRQIASALEVVHAAGVVHRDLKPSNVLFRSLPGTDADGASERLLLADFGMAQLDTGGAVSVLGGTPAYAAPEQLVEGGVADARSDLYAAAAITYELLAGRSPPRGAAPQDAVVALRRARPDLPHRLGEALSTGLAVDPAQRWPSAARWNEWLGHALTDPNAPTQLAPEHTVIDRPGPQPPEPPRPAPRARWAIPLPPRWRVPALAALGALLLLAVAAVFLLRGQPPVTGGGGGGTSPSPTVASPSDEATASPTPQPTATPPATPTPSATPTATVDPARVDAFIARVPAPLNQDCDRVEGGAGPTSLAGLLACYDPTPSALVWYYLHGDRRQMIDHLRIEEAGVEPGLCGQGSDARTTWKIGEEEQGALVCEIGQSEEGEFVWITWTYDDLHVLAWLHWPTRDDAAAFEYWRSIAALNPP